MFEKALANLNKMPRIWLMYIEFLIRNRAFVSIRRAIDGALRALPVTQHGRIWDLVINEYIGSSEFQVPMKTCKRLLERYLEYEPEYSDAVVNFLVERGEIASAVELLVTVVESSESDSTARFLLLVELISKNSNKLKSLERMDLPAIIRAGLSRYPSKQGELWNAIADYYIRQGMFSKATEIFEEALDTVNAVVDFSVIFESYQNFLELVVETKLAAAAEDVEMDLQRLELVLERRAEILSSVLLRQNPNNVIEWIKRTRIPRIAENPGLVSGTFETALRTVDAESSNLVGRVSNIWIEYAKTAPSTEESKAIFERAILGKFRTVDDLASVWIEYVLLELREAVRLDSWKGVLEIARRAISQYSGSPKGTIQAMLYRSVKLWHLALDIEDSVHGESKPELVRGIYNAMMELRVITPQTILNYSKFELENLYFEKSIQVLEKGIGLFPWPHCRDIWLYYLSVVVEQKKRFSTERVRDLFEQAIKDCPESSLAVFMFHYYKFEIERGLARNAISVLRRAAESVPVTQRAGFWYLAIKESTELLGSAAARSIFEQAIESYTSLGVSGDIFAVEFCVEFCIVEGKLGQVERGRALLKHGSQFANPNRSEFSFFWDYWKNFEIEHGNEGSYKQMKRLRRLVEVQYSEKHFNVLDVGVTEAPPAEMSADQIVVEEDAPTVAKGIDLSKLKQMASQMKSSSSSGEAFIAASAFEGTREGYVFRNGANGLGYYKDI